MTSFLHTTKASCVLIFFILMTFLLDNVYIVSRNKLLITLRNFESYTRLRGLVTAKDHLLNSNNIAVESTTHRPTSLTGAAGADPENSERGGRKHFLRECNLAPSLGLLHNTTRKTVTFKTFLTNPRIS